MAEGDIGVYNHAKEQMLAGALDFDTDAFRLILLGTGYTYSPLGNNGYANVSAQEISTTNYTATGELLTGLSISQDDANTWAKWDAADVTWTALGTTVIEHGIIYDDTITTPVADPLICQIEIATNSNGNDYTVSWHANGIFYLA